MLQLKSVTVGYRGREVLRGIELGVRAGEVVALIGPNGVGKSTLLRAAAGQLAPVRGQVLVNGQPLHPLAPAQRARWVAVVPQAIHLPEAFTAREVVLMGRTPYLGWLGHEQARDHEAARQAMARTHTLALADRRVGALSGGEQQRVLLARALAQAAPILLLDEPTAHLDLRHQGLVLTLVRDLARAEGLAVVIALHDLNLAAQYADRVMLLTEGAMRVVGAPAEVLTAPHLSAAYAWPVSVVPHPVHGRPLVLPEARAQNI